MFLAAQCGDLFAGGRSSREVYTEIFAAYLVTFLQVDLLVATCTCLDLVAKITCFAQIGVFDPNKFRSYAAFQTHENYFRDATSLVERTVDQPSLFDTNIPKWFAHKDWNYLLSNLDKAYGSLVKEFYANAIVEGEELKCWVKRKSFSISLAYLAEILHINRPMLKNLPIYDVLCPDEDLLRDALGKDLKFLSNGNSVSVSSLPPKLRVLTIIMFHNLYPLSSIGYMNLGRALFLHDLISDVEIDICAHIFHVLRKTVLRIDSRTCIPFCCLISRILKLKGIHPSIDESLCTKSSPINMRMFNASIGHSRKGIKMETSASHSGSRSSSCSLDEKLDNIMASIYELSTKMSGLASILHHYNIRCDMKFTSLQTQLD
nr:hypothetical protein CFP56_38545 [Quercus suber]